MKVRNASVGYWGIPGRTGGKTHINVPTDKGHTVPLCGQKMHKEAEYQWCMPLYLAERGSVECDKCRRTYKKHRDAGAWEGFTWGGGKM